MLKRAEVPLPCLGEQLAERRHPVEIGAQHEGVEEQPDQALQLPPAAVRHRHADEDRALAGQAVEEGVERREQEHVERGVLLRGQRLQPGGQARREGHVAAAAGEALERRTRVVGRQLDRERRPLDLPLPVVDQLAQTVARERAPLPGREVRVLHRQLRQRRGEPGREGVVEVHCVAEEHADRPDVADDVLQDEEDDRLLGRQAQQAGAGERRAGEVERQRDLGVDHPGRLGLAPRLGQRGQVDDGERQPRLGFDDRHRLAVAHHDAGAQGLMPAGDLDEAGREHPHVEQAPDAHGTRDVIRRAARLELLDEPKPLLGEGKHRLFAGPAARHGRRRRGGPRRLPPLDLHQLQELALAGGQAVGHGRSILSQSLSQSLSHSPSPPGRSGVRSRLRSPRRRGRRSGR